MYSRNRSENCSAQLRDRRTCIWVPSRCGRFPEVPLGQIRVFNSVNESQSLHREAIGSYRLETGHGDLDVDDWLSGQTRDRGGPYVVNAKSDVAKRCTQLCTQATEEAGPSSIIGNYFNSLRQQGPSDTLDGRKLVSTPALHYPVSFNLTAHEYRSFWCLLCTANVSLEVPTIRKAGRLGRDRPDNGSSLPGPARIIAARWTVPATASGPLRSNVRP